jgi:hypothetical protein
MENSDPLVWFGWAVILLMGGLILVPFFTKRAPLLTSWNMFLMGIAMFMGAGCLEVKYGDFAWANLQWFQPTIQEVQWYMAAGTVFLISLLLSYRYNTIIRRLASRSFQKWPPTSTLCVVVLVVLCMVFVAASFALREINFIGQIVYNLAQKAAICAVVLSFDLWFRKRLNLLWLGMFACVFAVCSVYAIMTYVGRRLLLSVVLGPVLVVYWSKIRLWRPIHCLAAMTVLSTVVMSIGIAYSSFRFFSRGVHGEERSTANIVEHLKSAGTTESFAVFFENKLHYLGQYNVHYSLLLERFVSMGVVTPHPLNTLAFLVCFPIPHNLWDEKPETIGVTLVRDVIGNTTTNWGVGIPGHGIYEGGMLALALYAFLFAILFRFIDEPLISQPGNPYLVSILAAAAPHVVGIPRGDFGIMTVNVLQCLLFVYLLGIAGRILFGTERSPQATLIGRGPQCLPGYVVSPRPAWTHRS